MGIDREQLTSRPHQGRALGNHFHAVFHSRYLWLWLLTPDGVLIDANDRALDAIDVARDGVVWRPVWETPWFVGEPAMREALRHAVDLAGSGEETRTVGDVFAQGGVRSLDLTVRAHRVAGGGIPTMLLLEGCDRSEVRDAERERDAVLAALELPVVVHGTDLSVRFANPAARSLTVAGPLPEGGSGLVDGENRPLPRDAHPAARALAEERTIRDVPVGVAGSGDTTWLRADARPLHHPGRSAPHGAVVVYRPAVAPTPEPNGDGTADADAASPPTEAEGGGEPSREEDRDALTGLLERAAFFRELERTLAVHERVAVLLLDVDHFRRVNDVHGHEAGDRLLDWLARQLEREVRPEDMAARLGADEFALLLRGVHDDDGMRNVAERVRARLRGGLTLDGGRIDVGASMGLARSRDGHGAETLMREAGYALEQAKRRGRGHWIAFDAELGRQRIQQLGIEAELEQAVEEDQLEVYYQPLVDAKAHEVVGAEALMRWRHPTRGLVPPAEFIPAAEQSGQIVAMEAWLQRRAMTQLREWNRSKPSLQLSMNLSARQLERSDFVDRFADVLDETGVNPANVIAEITETFAMQHPHEAGRVLAGLADLGVALAIDDFGTGYSNLGQLQHLPFQIVKIDRGFLRDVPENQRNFALVRTIIAMAQSLELRVIAEGVETKTQADFLYWEGANWLQGYHFGRPMPTATFGQVALGGALPLGEP